MSKYNIFTQQIGNHIPKTIWDLEYLNLETTICPFPLYSITFPAGYPTSMTEDTKISKLSADIFLSGLNTTVVDNQPATRKVFVLPLQEGDPTKQHASLTTNLHFVMNSYPRLNTVIVPYRRCVLVHYFSSKRFQVYTIDECKDHETLVKSESTIRKAIIEAFKIARFHYDKKWQTYSERPLTEDVCLFLADDGYTLAEGEEAVLSSRNHITTVIEYDNCDTTSHMLLIAVNIMTDPNPKTQPVSDYHIFDVPNAEKHLIKMMSLFPKLLGNNSLRFLKLVTQLKMVKKNIYEDSEDFNYMDLSTLVWNEIHSHCTELCGRPPDGLDSIYDEEHIQIAMNPENFAFIEHVNLAVRSIVDANRNIEFQVIPILSIQPESLLLTQDENCLVSLDEKYQFEVGKVYGFFSQNSQGEHIYFATFQIVNKGIKTIKHPRGRNRIHFQVTIYDSLERVRNKNDDAQDEDLKAKCIIGYTKEKYEAALKHPKYIFYDNEKEITWFGPFFRSRLLPAVCNNLWKTENGVRSKVKLNQIQLYKGEWLQYWPSIIYQGFTCDNTCGANAFITCVLLMLGKDLSCSERILSHFQKYEDYHVYMTDIMLFAVGQYMKNNEFVIDFAGVKSNPNLVPDPIEPTNNKLLKDCDEFKRLCKLFEEKFNQEKILSIKELFGDDVASLFTSMISNESNGDNESLVCKFLSYLIHLCFYMIYISLVIAFHPPPLSP